MVYRQKKITPAANILRNTVFGAVVELK